MDELREKIATIIAESSLRYHDDGPLSLTDACEWADEILTIPEIAEALLLFRSETVRFDETTRPFSPSPTSAEPSLTQPAMPPNGPQK